MQLYLGAQSNVPDITIEHIEVRLNNGETATLSWEYSVVKRTTHGFHAVYTGLFWGPEYAVGKLEALQDMIVVDTGLHTKTGMFPTVFIQSMRFLDSEDCLEFSPPIIKEVL